MRIKYIVYVLLLSCVLLTGCSSWIIRPAKVILLPEERIFSLPAGQEVSVTLDGKPLKMVFPETMKLVSPTVLIRQEERLNNETLKSIQANSKNKATWGIIGSIFAIIAGVVGIIFRKSFWPKISGSISVK